MDRYEGDSESPLSLHKYLYAGSDPIDALDPTGRDFDLGSIGAAIGAASTILAQSLPPGIKHRLPNLFQPVPCSVPQLVDAVSNALIFAQSSLEAGSIAVSVVEQMASNLENVNGQFWSGASPMGSDVENAAGANLQRSTKSYDHYDAESQTAIQIKGTRQTSSPGASMGVIQGVISNL
jgi:hypothetical protein